MVFGARAGLQVLVDFGRGFLGSPRRRVCRSCMVFGARAGLQVLVDFGRGGRRQHALTVPLALPKLALVHGGRCHFALAVQLSLRELSHLSRGAVRARLPALSVQLALHELALGHGAVGPRLCALAVQLALLFGVSHLYSARQSVARVHGSAPCMLPCMFVMLTLHFGCQLAGVVLAGIMRCRFRRGGRRALRGLATVLLLRTFARVLAEIGWHVAGIVTGTTVNGVMARQSTVAAEREKALTELLFARRRVAVQYLPHLLVLELR